MKQKNKLLIIVFLLIIFVPPLFTGVYLKYSKNNENRSLAEFPIFEETGIKKFPSSFEEWWNDHLPFKNELTTFNSYIRVKLLNTTSNRTVILGKGEWLFYNNYTADDNPINDILGYNMYTKEQMDKIADNISIANETLKEKDIEFYVFIPPNKETIYKDYLPNYLIEESVDKTSTEILYEYLISKNLNVLYPKQELLEASENFQTYYTYDTHWNKLGGYVGFSALCKKLQIDLPPISNKNIMDATTYPVIDLANLLAMEKMVEQELEKTVKIEGMDKQLVDKKIYDSGEEAYFTTPFPEHPNPPHDKTVLIIHDSYYKSMIEYFPLVFTKTIAVHRDYANLCSTQEMIEKYNPNIVILEVVERGSKILLHENMPY